MSAVRARAAKLFGYPFRHEPLRSAAAELVSSLALPAEWNFPRWYASRIHPWQSRSRPAARALIAPPVGVAALWSLAVFACQFAFYLRARSMTSRYAVDFAAPFAVGVGTLLVTAFRTVDRVLPDARRHGARLLVALWTLRNVAAAEIAPSHRAGALFDARQVVAALQRSVPEPRPLPDAYRCGDDTEAFGIKFDGSGWTTPGSCEVHAATMLFLERPTCVRVHVAPTAGAPALGPEGTAMVRAKLGLSEMRRATDVAAGADPELTFCAPPGHRPNPYGIELLYLGWTAPDALSPDVRPFRLLEIAKVAAP